MSGKFVFLHLSDLHFGDENETDAARRKNTLDKLLLTLKDLPAEWKPQSIVISGDIGWSGINNDYNLAEIWLRKLLRVLGLSAEDIIPAPGNHDINLNEAAATAVPSDHITADELLDIKLLEKVSEPFKGFEDFCKRMGIPPLALGSKTSFLAGSREHKGMMWLVLNSAWFCRKGRMENLHIGKPHLDVITAAVGWGEKVLPTIGVLHHPMKYFHDEELYCYDRRITYKFLAEECNMILSGHAHGTLNDPDAMYLKTYVFTGGSSYNGDQVQNNFSIFRFYKSTGTIERRAYEWDTADGDWEHREKYSRQFPLLGGEKKPALAVGVTRGFNEAELEAYYRDYEDLRRSLTGRDISEWELLLKEGWDLHQMLFTGSRRHYEALRNENGRFCHLDISDIIIQEPKKEWIDSTVKEDYHESESKWGESSGANRKLRYSIPRLWIEGGKHTILKGDGGMGKTVSLVRLWDELTRQYDPARPVPVFIQLNEINTVPEEKRMDFILSTILRNYFNNKVGEEEILQLLIKPCELPAVVLLLDGFNEVTVDNKELLIQVRKLMEQARGVQVIITSRYDMRKAYGWEHLHLLELAGLEEAQVREYLEEKKVEMPGSQLAGLLRNPMMLTLYTSTCEVQGKYAGDYKRHVETTGELLWNFMEAQAAVLLERLNYDQKKWWFYKFLLKFMLPAMGYEMEKAGLFAFDRGALYGALDKYCLRFSRPDFFRTFADYAKHEESLPTGACADDKARRKKVSEIEAILCNVLFMVVKEGETYRFLHQDFRDYFAALHVLHEAEMGVKRSEVAEVLKERALPVYIRRFMGEIEGEHYQRPVFQEGKGWLKKENGASLLNRVLDLCRGVFEGSVGFVPWNIIEVWKEVRGELSGADLSRLDLSRVVLNGSVCSRFFRSDYLAACFNGSVLHEMCLFPRGHSGTIFSAVYNEDGKKILSASADHTIKEWDVESGLCLKTFSGHTGGVRSALYSGDEKKILSASGDRTIKEWDVKSGQCLKTFTGHESGVWSAVYSGDKEKILSASWDHTIKEWDVESGQCLKTFTGHMGGVTSALYSGDEEKILSASDDSTIKEWDVESGQCLKTFTGHEAGLWSAVYSGDGEKILSASNDHNIKEWDVESGQCLKTFVGHTSFVYNAVYSGDGKKILSTSNDHTIKKWDVESGQCLKTFTGHTFWVSSAVYSGDEKKILSASDDRTIKEWDVESGQCLKTFTGHEASVWSAVYSGDGEKILSASYDATIKEWDVESGQCLKTFTGHTGPTWSVSYSGDGEKILSASPDGTIKEWDGKSGQCLKTFIGHTSFVYCAVYSGDGKKILSASNDETLKEWDVANGQCLKTFAGHTNRVMSAVYSVNGEKILSASHDDTIKEWDVASGHCLKTFIGHALDVTRAVYNGDCKKILSASADQTIKEWDVESGRCLKTFTGHQDAVFSAVYSGDGKKILSTSWDKTIKEWDMESEQCLKTFIGHTGWVISAVYSRDGKKILSASRDNTIKEWDVASGQCLETTKGNPADFKAEENPGETGKKILAYGNNIYISPSRTIINIPGLFIQGCSFKNLNPDSDLSEESKELMRQYGAKM